MTLPDTYVVPHVGDMDRVGYPAEDVYCLKRIGNLVCTLPFGHWGAFHVAHSGIGTVLAVEQPPVYLRVPTGL
mgnify:CR=1 FL=1